MRRRILSMLITLAMMFSLLPTAVFAEETSLSVSQFTSIITASIADITITGTVGEGLEIQTATVTLEGDTFVTNISGDVSDWFTALPNGIIATGAAVINDTTITMNFGCTPEEALAAHPTCDHSGRSAC